MTMRYDVMLACSPRFLHNKTHSSHPFPATNEYPQIAESTLFLGLQEIFKRR